jgi:hypothetical protein
MRTIMINCPTTGKGVSTGIIVGEPEFFKLSHLPGSMRCPMCKENHEWAGSNAWLAPVHSLTAATSQEEPPSRRALSTRLKIRRLQATRRSESPWKGRCTGANSTSSDPKTTQG